MRRAYVLPLAIALAALGAGCAVHQDATEVFVRDPHKVWVEGWTSNGARVLLGTGQRASEVRIHADIPPRPEYPTYATLEREPNGGITLDYPGCAPWPVATLDARGQLKVVREHGEERLATDGRTMRIPFRCGNDEYTTLDLAFVTPLSNVREVHIIHDAVEEPIAEASSHPSLQAQAWVR